MALAVNTLGLGGTEKAVQTARAPRSIRVGSTSVSLPCTRGESGAGISSRRHRGRVRRWRSDSGCASSRRGRCRPRHPGRRGGTVWCRGPSHRRASRCWSSRRLRRRRCLRRGARLRMHLFPSKMCALRYRRRLGLAGPEFHARHRVSHWPVDIVRLRGFAPERGEAKRLLGLDPERPVVARVGRSTTASGVTAGRHIRHCSRLAPKPKWCSSGLLRPSSTASTGMECSSGCGCSRRPRTKRGSPAFYAAPTSSSPRRRSASRTASRSRRRCASGCPS